MGGVQGPALGPLAGCRGRAPAGGPGGGAPGRFWIYAFQSTAYTHRYTHRITLFIETDIAENADINFKLVTGVTYDISKKKTARRFIIRN